MSAALHVLAVIALRLHHHVRGPGVGYLGLFLAAVASWAGVAGPGEAALITAGILAAHRRLDIGSVLFVAWVGATAGGIAGWLVGLKAGRALVTAPGPLRGARRRALARGDRFYARYGALAVFLTPSWVAGINGMPWTRYLPANALAALAWALSIGAGAYFVGPSISDLVADLGLVSALALGAIVVAAVVGTVLGRRRARG